MFDPSQLLNAMLSGGVRGSPLSDLLSGALGGGAPTSTASAGMGPASGNPLGSILGGLLGGGNAAGFGGGGGLGGGGLGGALGQVLGGMFGGGTPAPASPAAGGGMLGSVLGGMLGGGGGRSSLGGMAGTALISALASAFLNRGSGTPAALAPQAPVDAHPQTDPTAAHGHALLLIRAMIAAAKADGAIDAEEQRRIIGKLKEAGADANALAFVEQEIAHPSSIDTLVAEVPDQMTAAQVYMASLFAIDVDTPAEKAYLARLAERLGLPEMSA